VRKDTHRRHRQSVHVLYGLSGNAPGLLREFEVSLKSVLLNAPIHSNLTIHITADQNAYDVIYTVFKNAFYFANISYDDIIYNDSYNETANDFENNTTTEETSSYYYMANSSESVTNETNETNILTLSSWRTLNSIAIRTYNVESYIDQWYEYIEIQANHSAQHSTEIHTIGTYFRLFAHDILDPYTVPYVIYIDTYVVVMAKLDHLWQYTYQQPTNDEIMFQWG
jgi:hypothetical protein